MPSIHFRLPPTFKSNLHTAISRLEFGLNLVVGLKRVRRWRGEGERNELIQYAGLLMLAIFSLYIMSQPLLFKLFLLTSYTFALLIPLTSQFFLPATPIFSWLLFFYSSQFIPSSYRPHIWVSVLPTLESVLYGANISDILTRTTNPFLDILAWLPYGVIHFVAPFGVAGALWVGGPIKAVKFWGKAFGYMNLVGVIIQIVVPCAPPWYELRNGLIPANYGMLGSPGGLARIDALFHSSGYTKTFTGAPVPFGAFPSLHAGCSTMEALFLSHFFPEGRVWWWGYVFWLYWSTMYLTHHYLIDLVAGGSLAVICFYYYLPEEMRHLHDSTPTSSRSPSVSNGSASRGDPELGIKNGSGNSYGMNGFLGNGEGSDEEDNLKGGRRD